MANTIFEKQGGTYTQVGDYMLHVDHGVGTFG